MADQITAESITIQRRLGITHALRDLVQSKHMQGANDISPEEWNKTVEVLKKLQQARTQANNPKSIFQRDVNLVYTGDKIEFTKDEMKQLYEAMGVSFSTPEGGEEDTPHQLTEDEKNAAIQDGKNVADDLVGYTNSTDQRDVENTIKYKVTDDNVLYFLAGYEKNKGSGNHFFRQLYSEYGFDQKKELIAQVTQKLVNYLRAHNNTTLANEILNKFNQIFANEDPSKSDVAQLDTLMIKALRAENLIETPETPEIPDPENITD